MVGNDEKGYYYSTGPIREVWVRNNWELGPLGFPVSDIIEESGKKYQLYEYGSILGDDGIGYYASYGEIRNKWIEFEAEFGILGFPVSDILTNTASGIEWQEFEHGFIVGNKEHGYHISMGPIRDKWVSQNWEFGILGFPKSDILEEGEKKYQIYDGGVIVYVAGRDAWIEY